MKPTLTPDQLDQAQNYDTYDIAEALFGKDRAKEFEPAVFNGVFFPDARPASEASNIVQFPRRAG